ncbi:MAG: histidine phosphotransferase [Boseongicola sp.]|nr:MAG: histidine phosphotransferase [Boseongicola sp.]
MDDNQLNALIGSRICHDLISPIGAIGNGVELLSMSGFGAAPEIALISESVENANAKIRFFRIAFGAAMPGTAVSTGELHSVLRDMYRGSRIRVNWKIDEGLPRNEVKLAFLLLQCIENALPWGGEITVIRQSGQWRIEAHAEKLKHDPELWDIVTKGKLESSVAASEVHFALVPIAMRDSERQIAAFLGDTQISLSF